MTFIAESEALATDIGRYRVVAQIARGGMGNVYLAIARGPGGFNKLVAVKELKQEFAEDETYVTMFLDEARLAARLTHPNIVQTNEVGSDANRHFMIMEYLDGRTLYRIARHLTRHDGFPVGAHLRIIAEALLGLHYAHELCDFDGQSFGIVHRDVSPLNVVVTFDGQAKVLDFGIAKSADSVLETRTGILKGRIAYMAPEQACGGKVDRRADVYSAGVMIWEAAAGRRLWPKMTDVEVLSHVLREGPPSLRAACPGAPAELDSICAKAMARQLDERYPTAAALIEDLEAHLARRDDAMPMREIGALIGRSFDGERRRMNAVIEESIVRVRESPRSGRMASLPRTSGTQPVSPARGLRDDLGSVPSLLVHTPASDPSLHVNGSSPSKVLTGARRAEGHESAAGARTPLPWIVITVAGCAVALALAVALPRRAKWPPAIRLQPLGPQVAAPAEVPTEAPADPRPRTMQLSIRVSPPGAQISVDGVVVRGNPYRARVAEDGLTHRIGAQADGCDPKTEEVSFASDVTIDITLDRHPAPVRVVPRWSPPPAAPALRPSKPSSDAPRPAPAAPERAAAPPSPAAPPLLAPPPAAPAPSPPLAKEVDPTGGRSPLRPIVTNNPYGSP